MYDLIEGMKKQCELAHPNGADPQLYENLIVEEVTEFLHETKRGKEDFKEAMDLVVVTMMYMFAQGYPVREGFEELSKEFMSKLYDKDGNYCPTYRESDGKLMKGENFKKCNLDRFFEEDKEKDV